MTTQTSAPDVRSARFRGVLARKGVLALAVIPTVLVMGAVPALASVNGPPSVLHVGQIASQDVPVLPGSEADTLVEPDVAVSPVNPDIAVAAAHNGRYPDGGAVGIDYTWTHDGGRTWHHQPLPGVTSTIGGPSTWERASDPIVAFAPGGSVYISTLAFNSGCDSAVLVSRSTDGGQTFAPPVVAHRSATCSVSDDKNVLVVDTGATSPHRGRVYQFWTPFLTDFFGNPDGSPQAVVWSDDGGRTWTNPVNVSAPHANSQDSQPMVQPDGTVVDAYIDFGPGGSAEGPEVAGVRGAARHAAPTTASTSRVGAAAAYPVVATVISKDGGSNWKPGGSVTRDLGGGPVGFRCCLISTTVDPISGRLFATWNSADPTKVKLSSSRNGSTWSAPVVVNRPTFSMLGVNSDVSAYAGTVSVSFGLTNADTTAGRFGRQFVATSRDGGVHFLVPTAVGPQIDYAYAAQARGIFPGDYIGSAMSTTRLYAVWVVSSAPPKPGATYHQVLFGATFDTAAAPLRTPSIASLDPASAVLNP